MYLKWLLDDAGNRVAVNTIDLLIEECNGIDQLIRWINSRYTFVPIAGIDSIEDGLMLLNKPSMLMKRCYGNS